MIFASFIIKTKLYLLTKSNSWTLKHKQPKQAQILGLFLKDIDNDSWVFVFCREIQTHKTSYIWAAHHIFSQIPNSESYWLTILQKLKWFFLFMGFRQSNYEEFGIWNWWNQQVNSYKTPQKTSLEENLNIVKGNP